jgi:hypothetical protein
MPTTTTTTPKFARGATVYVWGTRGKRHRVVAVLPNGYYVVAPVGKISTTTRSASHVFGSLEEMRGFLEGMRGA